ncbi:MAG: site-specific DNA-methyltransferase [Desulfovibrio sp.]|jgi:adenine-specific DNA-methyltransferase|nr:site-specific DNA-methyltransferase [Desulfovibrio sp.]
MQKFKMRSPDMTQDNIAKIRELFPNCVTEAHSEVGEVTLRVDFDLLRQELSSVLVEGAQERYRLDWPGKRQALLTANAPIAKTLRPCREESVDFDTTKNLYIEGDNLDALKLLQESYLGKVKMIYIDPPYNTGNDFIYEDDFAEDIGEYFRKSNQKDGEGNRLVLNSEANGRFHSDWLTMMYSRIRLARNLLRDDGVIFISCDDHEIHNMRKICDEIFGEKSIISSSFVLSNPRGRQSDTYIATVHDSLLIYSKNINSLNVNGMLLTKEERSDFNLIDNDGEAYRLLGLRQRGAASKRSDRPDMYFPIYVCPITQAITLNKIEGWHEVFPKKSDGSDGRWMWGKEKCLKDHSLLVARLIERRNEYDIFVKDFLNKSGTERTRKHKSVWNSKGYNNQAGTQEVKAIFNADVMSFPKSKQLLIDICNMGSSKNDIILDFFSGSATTAHAVMQLNAEDGGNRRFIMVQLPELCDEKSEAFKAGYTTIAEIGKERIRRAGKKIKEDNPLTTQNLDTGFRVLKVDSSCMEDVYYTPDQIDQKQLSLFADNIKADRRDKPEDLLYQVLIDWGVELHLPIKPETIQGKKVFFVDENALAACFDSGINESFVQKLAKHKPLRAVFRDAGFASDAARINAEQIFKQLSPQTEVKVI